MPINIHRNRNFISNWALVFFILLLVVSALVSEFFQAPTLTSHEFNKYRYLFDSKDLQNINNITLKNRLGDFKMARSSTIANSVWTLKSPRLLPANNATILKIFETLKKIKIKKVFQLDPINLSNFSLNSPLIEITLQKNKEKEITLKFGLINPIDNSTYITLLDSEAIYHIDALEQSFETLDLSNFINSSVLNVSATEIASLIVYGGLPQKSSTLIKIKKVDEEWVDNNNKPLSKAGTNQYLSDLTSIRSNTILDELDEKQKEQIAKYLKRPSYSIEITKKDGGIITCLISPLIKKLKGVKMERRQNFIMTASNRIHPYLVSREFLAIFLTKQRSIRKGDIKRLFY